MSSLYEWIKEHIVDGSLPKQDSSLPPEEEVEEGKLKFADGAKDGICMYHMARSSYDINAFYEIPFLIEEGKNEEAEKKLSEFSKQNSALSVIDGVQEYIIEHRENLDPSKQFNFAYHLIKHSNERELVKYGLCILELFSYRDESYDEILRTLALSDEFSLFVAFLMREWENAEEELLEAAKKVKGWGRIFIIEQLEATKPETKYWLLTEGIHNTVLSQYSALTCFEKTEMFTWLNKNMTKEEFHGAGEILESLIQEGPCAGISAIEEADELILRFLNQAENQNLDVSDYEIIFNISDYTKLSSSLKEKCRSFLETKECTDCVNKAVTEGKGFLLAKKLGLPYKEAVFHSLEDNFEKNYFNISFLMPDGDYIEECIALFERRLPLDMMKTGPEKLHWGGEKYNDHTILSMIVQFLKPYQGKGIKLIETALQSPIINTRLTALSVLEEWQENKNEILKDNYPQIVEILKRDVKLEPDDKVKEKMEKLL